MAIITGPVNPIMMLVNYLTGNSNSDDLNETTYEVRDESIANLRDLLNSDKLSSVMSGYNSYLNNNAYQLDKSRLAFKPLTGNYTPIYTINGLDIYSVPGSELLQYLDLAPEGKEYSEGLWGTKNFNVNTNYYLVKDPISGSYSTVPKGGNIDNLIEFYLNSPVSPRNARFGGNYGYTPGFFSYFDPLSMVNGSEYGNGASYNIPRITLDPNNNYEFEQGYGNNNFRLETLPYQLYFPPLDNNLNNLNNLSNRNRGNNNKPPKQKNKTNYITIQPNPEDKEIFEKERLRNEGILEKLIQRGLIDPTSHYEFSYSIEKESGKDPVINRIYNYKTTDAYNLWENLMWEDPMTKNLRRNNEEDTRVTSRSESWIDSYLNSQGHRTRLARMPNSPIQYDPTKVSPAFISDLLLLRYDLNQSGIFDSNSGDWFTRDMLKQYLLYLLLKGNFIPDNDLFRNFSNDEIIDIINYIGQNNTPNRTNDNGISIARKGRLILRRKLYYI